MRVGECRFHQQREAKNEQFQVAERIREGLCRELGAREWFRLGSVVGSGASAAPGGGEVPAER